jgi:hypothetical protein
LFALQLGEDRLSRHFTAGLEAPSRDAVYRVDDDGRDQDHDSLGFHFMVIHVPIRAMNIGTLPAKRAQERAYGIGAAGNSCVVSGRWRK